MTWIGERVRGQALVEVYSAVAELANWSPWEPFTDALADPPRLSGVYLFREPANQLIRYASMPGERAGSGRPLSRVLAVCRVSSALSLVRNIAASMLRLASCWSRHGPVTSRDSIIGSPTRSRTC